MTGALNPSTKRDISRAVSDRVDTPGVVTFPLEEFCDDVDVVVRSEAKTTKEHKSNIVLYVSVIVDNACTHTGRMLGYPSSLAQFPDDLSLLPAELKLAIDTGLDRSSGATFPYNHKESKPPEAWYTAVFDIWLEDDVVSDLWVRALPPADD